MTEMEAMNHNSGPRVGARAETILTETQIDSGKERETGTETGRGRGREIDTEKGRGIMVMIGDQGVTMKVEADAMIMTTIEADMTGEAGAEAEVEAGVCKLSVNRLQREILAATRRNRLRL